MDASHELAKLRTERSRATTRHAAEEKLVAAKAKASEPWGERVEDAKHAARDVDRRYRAHVAAHLTSLFRYYGRTAGSPPNESTPQPPT